MALSAQQFTQLNNSPLSNTPGDSHSVNIVDVNGDGLDDVFISNGLQGGQNSELYLNLGNGISRRYKTTRSCSTTAHPTAPLSPIRTTMATSTPTWSPGMGRPIFFYRNVGNGNFTHLPDAVTGNTGTHSETAAFGDYDNDGLVDVYITNSGGDDLRDFLYRNTGNNGFVKINTAVLNENTASRSANWADYDNDGDLDLFVTRESQHINNLFRNKAAAVLSKSTTTPLLRKYSGFHHCQLGRCE